MEIWLNRSLVIRIPLI